MSKNNWSREELIVAFNLYCKTPFTKINASNQAVKQLAPVLGRSASSVALKLANFARLDPALQERNISGMRHGSKGEVSIWNEFKNNWGDLAYQSEQILAKLKKDSVENAVGISKDDLSLAGKECEVLVKNRVNQSFFRRTVLASYNNRCCITGISMPELLIASHIVPWAKDLRNGVNPCNGLCLNALHDKAFDSGLLTVTTSYKIMLSEILLKKRKSNYVEKYFLPYEGLAICLPQKFLPDSNFLEYHNRNIFVK